MLGIFVHFRGGAIWFTWLGVVLAVTAAFVWFQGLVSEHDAKPASASSPPAIAPDAPSVTPSFTATPERTTTPAVTAPSREKATSPKPTSTRYPSSSETDLTPTQIFEKIRAANAFNRDHVRNAFVGLSVNWTLVFSSAVQSGDTMLVFLSDDPPSKFGETVACSLPLKGNERFPLMDQTDRFNVKGTIQEPPILGISLKNVSIEKIP